MTAVRHRRQGVARVALRAALAAIGRRGGGMVEAYPTTTPENGNWQHAGTMDLFEREGFTTYRSPELPYVVMRRIVEPTNALA